MIRVLCLSVAIFVFSQSVAFCSPMADFITSGIFFALGGTSYQQSSRYSKSATNTKSSWEYNSGRTIYCYGQANWFYGVWTMNSNTTAYYWYRTYTSDSQRYAQLADSDYQKYENELKKKNAYKGMGDAFLIGGGVFLMKGVFGLIQERNSKFSNIIISPRADMTGGNFEYCMKF